MRWYSLLPLLFIFSACKPKPKLEFTQDASAPIVKASSAPSASAAPSAATVLNRFRATSAEPLLAARLDGDKAAVLLEPVDRATKEPPGTLVIYARTPILTIGAPVEMDVLSNPARGHIESIYNVHGAIGDTCQGTLEGFAVVHRIPADDPTAGKDGAESDEAWAKRVYGNADKEARVAIVSAPRCPHVYWAAPRTAAAMTDIPVHPAAKNTAKRLAPVLQMDDAFQSFKAGEKFDATYDQVGEKLVWVRATSGPNASCFLVAPDGRSMKILGSAGSCPADIRAATHDASRNYVWFDHAVATIDEGKGPEITYFPTASFGTAAE